MKYKGAKNLFEFFGFSDNKIDLDFYILDIKTDINYFQENYDFFIMEIKKMIIKQ